MPSWITEGFEDFSRGTCGNAGQNLYVSANGVLQRIHQFDLNGDGYLDLVFCNSQEFWEKPPAYVYVDPLGESRRVELPADATQCSLMTDLTGDGYDDLVLGMGDNGIRRDLNARIYFGSAKGLSERYQLQLPAPECACIAAGDFTGNGRVDLAFASAGRLRLFYQSELRFEPLRFVDLDLPCDGLAAADLNGNGCTDLVLRAPDGSVSVFWSHPTGIDPERKTPLDLPEPAAGIEDYPAWHRNPPKPQLQIVELSGRRHISVPHPDRLLLFPVGNGQIASPKIFNCTWPMAVAVGDLSGDGHQDLVVACGGNGQSSVIFWGRADGFDDARRYSIRCRGACDVAVADLDGDGRNELIVCQDRREESYTNEALIYRGTAEGIVDTGRTLVNESARRVFVSQPDPSRPVQVVFANYFAGNALGDVPASIFWGGPDKFSADRVLRLPGWGAVTAICADLTDDGNVDLVLGNAAEDSQHRDPGSYVYLNRGNGEFDDRPDYALPTTRTHGAACADLNRDGYLDLIFAGFDNPELLIFYGGPDGFDRDNPRRIRMELDQLYSEPRWVHLADLNNDGWLDLFVPQITEDRSFILWGGPEGFSMGHCQSLPIHKATCARTADLSGNGYLDLIVGGHTPTVGRPQDTFLHIYWNGPEGLQENRCTLLPAFGINSLSIADFNNDGALDIFACSYHMGLRRDIESYIWWNRPGRGFSETDFTRLFNHSASGSVAADFDDDGYVDLAIAYHKHEGDHRGHASVWWNEPDGFKDGRETHLPVSGPHGMTSVDPGNSADRGPEEYYESEPFHLEAGTTAQSIRWSAELPPKSWVGAQLRSAPVREALSQALWLGPEGETSWYENGQAVRPKDGAGPWIQYRLALGAKQSGASPRITRVEVECS